VRSLLLTDETSVEDFFSVAAYLRDRINPSLFVYGFSVAVMHRPDCRNVRLPPVTETFPGNFVDGAVFGLAREESTIMNGPLIPRRVAINSNALPLF
jgi:tyrosinase